MIARFPIATRGVGGYRCRHDAGFWLWQQSRRQHNHRSLLTICRVLRFRRSRQQMDAKAIQCGREIVRHGITVAQYSNDQRLPLPRRPIGLAARTSSHMDATALIYLVTTTPHSIDLDRLLKLRLVVARFGEMDLARWWNTTGQLGPLGAVTLRRGFPRTHYFAQARSVFAVAAHRCDELFRPPNCVTLWRLPEAAEQEFDSRWEHWLDNASEWSSLFEKLAAISGTDLVASLQSFDVVSDRDIQGLVKLRRSSEGRAVQLPGTYSGSEDDLSNLALGFARGEPGSPVVPYARTNGS